MRLTAATKDDWIVDLDLERDGKTCHRKIGVSTNIQTQDDALNMALWRVNTMRMRIQRRAWKVVSATVRRRWQADAVRIAV